MQVRTIKIKYGEIDQQLELMHIHMCKYGAYVCTCLCRRSTARVMVPLTLTEPTHGKALITVIICIPKNAFSYDTMHNKVLSVVAEIHLKMWQGTECSRKE